LQRKIEDEIGDQFYQEPSSDIDLNEHDWSINKLGQIWSDVPFDYVELKKKIYDFYQKWGDKNKDDSDWGLSVLIHKYLKSNGFNGYHASRLDIWHYMNAITFRDYVFWRWYRKSEEVTKNRFFGNRHNALIRLWFWAETTYDSDNNDPYHLTRKKFNQDIINYSTDTILPRNRDLFPRLCNAFQDNIDFDKPGSKNYIIEVMRHLKMHNAAVKLSFYNDGELSVNVKNIIDQWC
jgi:hypothetical protein